MSTLWSIFNKDKRACAPAKLVRSPYGADALMIQAERRCFLGHSTVDTTLPHQVRSARTQSNPRPRFFAGSIVVEWEGGGSTRVVTYATRTQVSAKRNQRLCVHLAASASASEAREM